MIRLAFITPTKYLNDFAGFSDLHLLLAHLVKKGNIYTEFYNKQNEIKILDNGLFENKVACSMDELLEKAALVGADVLVAPDVLYKPKETYESTCRFVDKLKEFGLLGMEVMAVPQADNPDDYVKSLTELQKIEGVSWIGLSKLSIPKSFGEVVGIEPKMPTVMSTRLFLTNLMEYADLVNEDINYHLLGLDFVGELQFQKRHPWIYSNDSSAAIWQVLSQQIVFNESLPRGAYDYSYEKVDFNTEKDLTDLERKRILHNIHVGRKFAK